jgi:hypothetical protein
MSDAESDISAAAREFHEDVPHRFQVSLTMSIDTRDRLGEIRDALNEQVGETIFTTDDAIRLALLAASRYHAGATGDLDGLDDIDTEQLVPLTAAVRRATMDDDRVPPLDDGHD